MTKKKEKIIFWENETNGFN